MSEIWIDVQLPWPWQICVLAMAAGTILIIATLPRWLGILRGKASGRSHKYRAARRYVRKLLLIHTVILGLSTLAVAALYGYDLGVSETESALQGQEIFRARGTLMGLQSMVPILVGLAMWGWLEIVIKRRSGTDEGNSNGLP